MSKKTVFWRKRDKDGQLRTPNSAWPSPLIFLSHNTHPFTHLSGSALPCPRKWHNSPAIQLSIVPATALASYWPVRSPQWFNSDLHEPGVAEFNRSCGCGC